MYLQGGHAEGVVIQRLDRMGRTVRDLLGITDELQRLNVALISLSDHIDTTTANGRLFFYLMATLSEYERDLMHERLAWGQAQARANGITFGRPRKSIDMDRVISLINLGVPKTHIAKNLHVSTRLLYRRLDDHLATARSPTLAQIPIPSPATDPTTPPPTDTDTNTPPPPQNHLTPSPSSATWW